MNTRIEKRMTKRLAMLVVPFLAVGALTVAAHAANPEATVKGQGIATMVATADDTEYGVFEEGDVFTDNYFAINARVDVDGSANGTAHFVFGDAFSNPWGADVITLRCAIDTGNVLEDGTVVLEGFSYEKDYAPGVFFTETTAFVIVIDPAGSFSLKWCLIPALDLEITSGNLTVD